MDTIKTLKGEKFQLKSATKLMEALDVRDEGIKSVWSKDMKITEMVVVSNEDEYDVLLCNTEKGGVIMTTVHGGHGMFNSCLVELYGKSLVAAFDRDEILHLFAIHENKVWHVKEQMPHSGNFTEAESVPFVHPLNFLRVEKLLILPFEKEKDFVLGVVTETADMKSFWVSYQEWDTNAIARLIPSSFSSPILTFSGKRMEELNVECASTTYTSYSVTEDRIRYSCRLDLPDAGDSVKQIFVPSTDTVFLLLHGTAGNLPVGICIDQQQGVASVSALAERGNYAFCSVYQNEAGKVSMALSGGSLAYIELTKDETENTADEVAILDKESSFSTFNCNPKCQRLYYVLQEDGLIHTLENQGGVTWVESTLQLPEEGEVKRIPCYSTELTFTHSDNRLVALPDMEVTLWAEARTYIETSQGILKLDTDIQAKIRTDAQGKISFKQYTNGLDVPVVYASLSNEYHTDEEVIVLSQFAGVHDDLSTITSQKLLDAKQTDSMKGTVTPFLPDKFRNKQDADNLAKGLLDVMKIKPQMEEVRLMKRSQLLDVSRVVPTDDLPVWGMTFESGHPVYMSLTKEEAQLEMNRMMQRSGGKKLPKWLKKIRDFCRSVVKGIVTVVKWIVDGVKMVVEFVLNGVKMIFDAVIKVVQEVFHFVETIFAAIAIFFLTIFVWLASLFIWKDVMRTKRAFNGLMTMFFAQLPEMAESLKQTLLTQLELGKGEIDKALEELISQMDANLSFDKYMQNTVPAEDFSIAYAMSNNPLQSRLENNNMQELTISLRQIFEENAGPFDELFNLVKKFCTDISDNPHFKESLDYFQKAFTDIDTLLSSLLCGLLSALRGIIQLIFSGMSAIISGVFDLMKTIMKLASKIFISEIKIPFFTSFYKGICGDKLTLLDLLCTFLALPTVLIYKAKGKSLPFNSDKDVENFIEYIKSILMRKSVMGLNSTSSVLLQVLSCVSSGVLYLVCSMDNFVKVSASIGPTLFDYVTIGAELIWFILCLPLLSTDSVEFTWTSWAFFGVGVAMDMFFTFYKQRKTDILGKGTHSGSFWAGAYGVGHLAISIWGYVERKSEMTASAFAAECIGSITEMSYFLTIGDAPKPVMYKIIGGVEVISSIAVPACTASDITYD